MSDALKIAGVADVVKSGAYVLSEMLRSIADGGGPMLEKLTGCLSAGEVPMLTIRPMSDHTGTVVELVTQTEGELSFTRHAILPILKNTGQAIN